MRIAEVRTLCLFGAIGVLCPEKLDGMTALKARYQEVTEKMQPKHRLYITE